MRVEIVLAWPRHVESLLLNLPEGATVADAVRRCGWPLEAVAGYAIHGVRAETSQPLHEGDRIELLRPLQADPKDARRRRAAQRKR